MKKQFFPKIILTILLVALLVTCLFACNTDGDDGEPTAVSITVVEAPSKAYIKGDPDFTLSNVIFEVLYSDKSVKRVQLDDSMISGEDRLKFQTVGTHTVTVNYNGILGFYGFEVVEALAEGEYLATFYSRGGTEIDAKAASVIKAFALPEREGYTFDGWYAEAKFDANGKVTYWGTKAVEPYTLTANTVFYAKWIDNRVCTVTFFNSDDSVIYEVPIHYGEKIDINAYEFPEELAVEGRSFIGWNVINGNPDEVITNLRIKANFYVEKCTIKIVYANTSGETISIERVFDYGSEFTVGPATPYIKPEKEGYESEFVMYVNNAEDNGGTYTKLPEDQTVILTEPYTTIMPLFTIRTYNVTIRNGKENQKHSNLKNNDIKLGQTYKNPTTGTKFTVDWNAGFNFADYTQEPNLSMPATLYDIPDAVWDSTFASLPFLSTLTQAEKNDVFDKYINKNEVDVCSDTEWSKYFTSKPKAFNLGDKQVAGYNGEWCFVVVNSDNTETWYNGSREIWNEKKQIFEPSEFPEGETDGEWILSNSKGEYIATVRNGKLTQIRNDVTVAALYTKKVYELKLIREDGGQQTTLVTFQVKYLSDINIYDLNSYLVLPNENGTATIPITVGELSGNDIKVTGYSINKNLFNGSSYLLAAAFEETETPGQRALIEHFYRKENIDETIRSYAINSGYYLVNDEDWTIEWYTDANKSIPAPDFINGEYIEISATTSIFCKDIDNRRYEVLFYYGYSFEKGDYTKFSGETESYLETETVKPPITEESVETTINEVPVSYIFTGWYDAPFSLYLKTGYRGESLTNYQTRKKSMRFYAHYECINTVSVKIFDKTQSVAYIGIDGYEQDAVYDNTIFYTLPIGTVFDMDMVYKGIIQVGSDGKQYAVSGQNYYNQAKTNAFYSNYFLNRLKPYFESMFCGDENDTDYYNNCLLPYLKSKYNDDEIPHVVIDNKIKELATITNIKKVLTALQNDYKNAINNVYTHNYDGYSEGEYQFYLTEFYSINSGVEKIINFRFEEFAKFGDSIKGALNAAGYNATIMGKLGEINDFIDFYTDLIYELNSYGYTNAQTGLTGIGYWNIEHFSQNYVYSGTEGVPSRERTSSYEKILTVISILAEYENLINTYYNDFTIQETTPEYSSSAEKLNQAYGYTDSLVKYLFSGWYTDKNYASRFTDTFNFGEIKLSTDIVLYAKWTDITRGTEGLVYEEVDIGGSYAYVLVDFTTQNEYTQAGYGGEYYYVTTNDTGAAPSVIGTEGNIEIQIPEQITKYLNKSAEAAADKVNWSEAYKEYFIWENETYVQALPTYNEGTVYYQKANYPVIGIKAGAFDRYAKFVSSVIIPTNLYFLEEGAFRYCDASSYVRTKGKTDEEEANKLNYVIVDDAEISIYQWEACPYANIVGRQSNILYNSTPYTIIAYAVTSDNTSYSLLAGTLRIGGYAFVGAVQLETLTGTENLTRISEYAFHNATNLHTLGNISGEVYFGKDITYIGQHSFENATEVETVSVEDGSLLSFVGRDAFLRTKWYEGKVGIKSLLFNDGEGRLTGIVLGYYVGSKDSDYGTQRYDADGTVNNSGLYYAIVSDNAMLLMNGSNDEDKHVIVNYYVRAISEYALKGLNAIDYKFIGLKYVGDKAFENSPSLTTIHIEDSYFGNATDLGEDIFYGKDTATLVTFGSASVKSTVIAGSGWDYYESESLIRYN